MAQWNFLHPKPIVLFYRCSRRPILIDKHAELDVQIVKIKGSPTQIYCLQSDADGSLVPQRAATYNMENIDFPLLCVCVSFSEMLLP